jgi:hypothetical protein
MNAKVMNSLWRIVWVIAHTTSFYIQTLTTICSHAVFYVLLLSEKQTDIISSQKI